MNRQFFAYLLASVSRVLYIGFTSDLEKRVWEHKTKAMSGFSDKYNVNRLVFCELFERADDGIAREQQLKTWSRSKKLSLIEQQNPAWSDLSYPMFQWGPRDIAGDRADHLAQRHSANGDEAIR